MSAFRSVSFSICVPMWRWSSVGRDDKWDFWFLSLVMVMELWLSFLLVICLGWGRITRSDLVGGVDIFIFIDGAGLAIV
jgi:hypothetical protein